MSRTRRSFQGRRSGGIAVAAVLLLFALGGDGAPVLRAQTPVSAQSAAAVFDSVAAAWLRGDAASLVAHFGPGRVLLRLPGTTSATARRFSHQQSLLILRDHLQAHVVRRFEFQHIQAPEMPAGKAVGLATISWRRLGVGRTKVGRMLVVLERGPDGWRLREMQALP